ERRRDHAGAGLARVNGSPAQVVAGAGDVHLVVAGPEQLAAGAVVGEIDRLRTRPVESLRVADAVEKGGLSRERVVGRHRAVGREAQQLAREAVDILRVIRTPGIPGSDIQHSVRAEADSAAIVELSGWNSIDDRAIEARRLVVCRVSPALDPIERLTTL